MCDIALVAAVQVTPKFVANGVDERGDAFRKIVVTSVKQSKEIVAR